MAHGDKPADSSKFPADERTTEPDLGVECPCCVGEDGQPRGWILRTIEVGTMHYSDATVCPVCDGDKMVDRHVALRYRATRSFGDPRKP